MIGAAIVFAVAMFLTRLIQNWLSSRFLPQTRLDAGVRNSVRTIFGYIGVIVAALLAGAQIGLDVQKLALIAGGLSVGIGFGLPMRFVYPMADISKIYPLWNYIPHNTLLWIGMRMGVVGYITFFGLIGMGVLTATRQLAIRKDPFLCAVAAGATAAIAAELVQGYYDLQLDAFRNLIFLGVLLGVLNRMPELADE